MLPDDNETGMQSDAAKVKAYLEKTRAMLPGILDKALESGDPGTIDRVDQLTTRINNLGQRTADSLRARPAQGGMEEFTAGDSPQIPDQPDVNPSNPPDELPSDTETMKGILSKFASPEQFDYPSDMTEGDRPRNVINAAKDRMARERGDRPSEPKVSPQPGGAPPSVDKPRDTPSPPRPGLEQIDMDEAGDVPPVAPPGGPPTNRPGLERSSREENPEVQANQDREDYSRDYTVNGNPKRDFADSAALMNDIMRSPAFHQAPPDEQEFTQRVMRELGPRPKRFTIEKVLAALALGAGSLVGAWMTHRYNGQALLDNDEEQRDYDNKRFHIGSQVYGANKAMDRANLAAEMRLAGIDLTEGGKNSRFAQGDQTKRDMTEQKIDAADRLADTNNAAKYNRSMLRERGMNERQDKYLEFKHQQILGAVAKMSDVDKRKYQELATKANIAYAALQKFQSDSNQSAMMTPQQKRAELARLQQEADARVAETDQFLQSRGYQAPVQQR